MTCKSPCITENHVDDGCGNPSSDDIHGIVRLDVNGGEAHQHEEGQYAIDVIGGWVSAAVIYTVLLFFSRKICPIRK